MGLRLSCALNALRLLTILLQYAVDQVVSCAFLSCGFFLKPFGEVFRYVEAEASVAQRSFTIKVNLALTVKLLL